MRMTAVLCGLAIAAFALRIASAGAQQTPQPAPNQPLVLDLPPAADAGKPHYFAPRDFPPSSGCAPLLDCRLKVMGALQHNGAVELNGAVFKW